MKQENLPCFRHASLYCIFTWKEPHSSLKSGKNSQSATVNLPDITDYGWYADGSIEWVEELYPSFVGDTIESFADKEQYEMEADSETESDDSDSDEF